MGNPFAYLVDTLFGLYTVALLLRFLLQLVRANFYNPVSRALVQITDPLLQPLRRFVPGAGGVDVASLVAMVLVQLAGTWLVFLLVGEEVTAPKLLSLTVYQLVDQPRRAQPRDVAALPVERAVVARRAARDAAAGRLRPVAAARSDRAPIQSFVAAAAVLV